MTEKKTEPADSAALRRRAEERLGTDREPAPRAATEDTVRLLHELQVHQIELEMQNAELRQARDDREGLLRLYTDLYDFAPVGYVTLDRNCAIQSINLTGAALLRSERSRLTGRPFAQFVANDARRAFAAFLLRVFAGPAKEGCEVALQTDEHAPRLVQMEGVADDSGDVCHIALIDVTERREAEAALLREKEAAEALRRAKETAEAAARSKSQFLANMSHELRTPMTGILGLLQICLKEELPPMQRDYLETTLGSARSLLRILNDILDMAKIDAGKLSIEEKPFSLGRSVSEVTDIFAPEVSRKGLHLALSMADEASAVVVGDHVRLRQVLTNLIGNAVKFTEKGRIDVHVAAGAKAADGKREFTFSVMDTGIGIPADKKELLFQAFSQVDSSDSRRYGGAGLGLAISREIVELMGGTIGVESREGVGSTFTFTIPLRPAVAESDSLTTADPCSGATTAPATEGGRIPHLLLAEDDPVNRKLFGLMLKGSAYEIEFAENGERAVEMWEKGDYDLVLMDVQMPRLNGIEATRVIREKERERGGHIPIVAITAHAFDEDEEGCLKAGMDAYISKPIEFKKCLQLIRDIVSRKPAGNHTV